MKTNVVELEHALRRAASGKDREIAERNRKYTGSMARPTRHRVLLTVRGQCGGRVEYFDVTIPTLSALDAETQARMMARASGWRVWATLTVEEVTDYED